MSCNDAINQVTEYIRAKIHLKCIGQVSQAAACDGLVYSVNYYGQNSGTQGYALPLIED